MEFDTEVKLSLYRSIADTAEMPNAQDIARSMGCTVDEVKAAFLNLHKKRLLVPEPGDDSRVRMAPPFSGVPTAFVAIARGKSYFANCIWDAYGILAALHEDGLIDASDGHTGAAIRLEVKDGKAVEQECVIHFAVPAAQWWVDVIYT